MFHYTLVILIVFVVKDIVGQCPAANQLGPCTSSSQCASGQTCDSTSGSCCNATTTTTNSTSSCSDNSTSCATWNSNGFCSSNFYNTTTKCQYCSSTCSSLCNCTSSSSNSSSTTTCTDATAQHGKRMDSVQVLITLLLRNVRTALLHAVFAVLALQRVPRLHRVLPVLHRVLIAILIVPLGTRMDSAAALTIQQPKSVHIARVLVVCVVVVKQN